jgi:hypothetical protein
MLPSTDIVQVIANHVAMRSAVLYCICVVVDYIPMVLALCGRAGSGKSVALRLLAHKHRISVRDTNSQPAFDANTTSFSYNNNTQGQAYAQSSYPQSSSELVSELFRQASISEQREDYYLHNSYCHRALTLSSSSSSSSSAHPKSRSRTPTPTVLTFQQQRHQQKTETVRPTGASKQSAIVVDDDDGSGKDPVNTDDDGVEIIDDDSNNSGIDRRNQYVDDDEDDFVNDGKTQSLSARSASQRSSRPSTQSQASQPQQWHHNEEHRNVDNRPDNEDKIFVIEDYAPPDDSSSYFSVQSSSRSSAGGVLLDVIQSVRGPVVVVLSDVPTKDSMQHAVDGLIPRVSAHMYVGRKPQALLLAGD